MQTIYSLVDPRTNRVRYIGATNNLKTRISNHLYGIDRGHCKNWIKSLTVLGLRPIAIVLDVVEDHQREDAERAWILGFRQSGASLTNLTDGGEGSPGHRHTVETKEKISLSQKGRVRSPATKLRISRSRWTPVSVFGNNRLLISISQDHREKIRAAKLEYWRRRRGGLTNS